MTSGDPSRSSAGRIAVVPLAVLLVAAPLLLGGAPVWSQIVIAGLSAIGCLAGAWLISRRAAPVPYGPLALVPVALLGLTALQAAPLPCGFADLVHADAARAARDAAALVGRDPWCAASLDPGATTQRLLHGLALACTFLAASTVAALVSRQTVIAAAGAACTVTAVVVLAHVLAGAETVYGWHAPTRGGHNVVTGPFVNPNTAGGVLVLGTALASGLAAEATRRADRAAWMGAGVVCAIATVATLSRGAMLALAAVILMLVWALAFRPRRGQRRQWPWPVLAIVPAALAGAVVGTEAALAHIQRDMLEGDRTKISLVARALEAALLGPWLGVGRGAFSASFTREMGTLTRFEHAENFIAEWSVDWGPLVGVGLAAALIIALGRAAMRAEGGAHRAAIVAMVGYGLSNLVDLGTEVLGSVVIAAAVFAAVTARGRERAWRVVGPRPAAIVATTSGAVALLATAALAVPAVHFDLPTARTRLQQLASTGDREGFAAALADAVVAHPHEAELMMIAAEEAFRSDDPSVLRWMNRAMVLAPGWVGPHVLAAQWLYVHRRHDQAELELREIARREPTVAVQALCGLQRARPRAESVVRVLGDVTDAALHTDSVARCITPTHAEAEALDAWLLERAPSMLAPRLRALRRELARGESVRVAQQAGELRAEHRADPELRLLLAQALFAAEDPDAAIQVLETGPPLGALAWDATALRARIHAARRDSEAMSQALEEMQGLARGDAGRASNVLLLRGTLHEQARHHGQALQAYEQARRLVPGEQALRGILRCSAALRDGARVATATAELCELVPDARECAERRAPPEQRVSQPAPSIP